MYHGSRDLVSIQQRYGVLYQQIRRQRLEKLLLYSLVGLTVPATVNLQLPTAEYILELRAYLLHLLHILHIITIIAAAIGSILLRIAAFYSLWTCIEGPFTWANESVHGRLKTGHFSTGPVHHISPPPSTGAPPPFDPIRPFRANLFNSHTAGQSVQYSQYIPHFLRQRRPRPA
jgi:hypothetical protein